MKSCLAAHDRHGLRGAAALDTDEAAGVAGQDLVRQHLPPKNPGEELSKLLQSWIEEGDAQEQKETAELLIRTLDEDRLSDRRLQPSTQKHRHPHNPHEARPVSFAVVKLLDVHHLLAFPYDLQGLGGVAAALNADEAAGFAG